MNKHWFDEYARAQREAIERRLSKPEWLRGYHLSIDPNIEQLVSDARRIYEAYFNQRDS